MKKENLIDDTLYNWFSTFSSGANNASHRGFPTKKDMNDITSCRCIMATFFMGTHLIDELEKMTRSTKPIPLIKGDAFKFKVTKKKVSLDKTLHETYDGIENIKKEQEKKHKKV